MTVNHRGTSVAGFSSGLRHLHGGHRHAMLGRIGQDSGESTSDNNGLSWVAHDRTIAKPPGVSAQVLDAKLEAQTELAKQVEAVGAGLFGIARHVDDDLLCPGEHVVVAEGAGEVEDEEAI